MKKTNRVLIVSIILVVLIIGAALAFGLRKQINKPLKLDKPGIANLKPSDKKIPDFVIAVGDAYNGGITNKYLEEDGVQLYEFDGAIDNGWDVVTNHYVGVKFSDILSKYNLTEYRQIDVTSTDGVKVEYRKYQLNNDNIFLVFYKDDELVNENIHIDFIAFERESRYSIKQLSEIYFRPNKETNETDNDNKENKDNEDKKQDNNKN